jgi:hypothetical protein
MRLGVLVRVNHSLGIFIGLLKDYSPKGETVLKEYGLYTEVEVQSKLQGGMPITERILQPYKLDETEITIIGDVWITPIPDVSVWRDKYYEMISQLKAAMLELEEKERKTRK